MKPSITLLENEKIVFECAPQPTYKFSLMLANIVLGIVLLVILPPLYMLHTPFKLSQLIAFLMHYREIVFAIMAVALLFLYLYSARTTAQRYYIVTNQRYISFTGTLSKNIISLANVTDTTVKKGLFNLYAVSLKLDTAQLIGKKRKVNISRSLSGLTQEQADKASTILYSFIGKNGNPAKAL